MPNPQGGDALADSPATSCAAVEHQISRAIADLDGLKPVDDPLVWAARCSLDAARSLLLARVLLEASAERDRELILDAVAQSRAAVSAATHAARS